MAKKIRGICRLCKKNIRLESDEWLTEGPYCGRCKPSGVMKVQKVD